MTRKKVVDPQDDIDTTCKLLCDEASNHMKVRNYNRALNVYNKVSALFDLNSIFVLVVVFALSFKLYILRLCTVNIRSTLLE